MPRTARLAVLFLLLSAGAVAGAADVDGTIAGRPASAKAIRAYLRGQLARAAGDAGSAVEALRLALVHDPESAQLRISYAEALARAGRLTSADAEARRAVQLTGAGAAGADANRVLGKVLLLRGQASAAEKALLRAIGFESERVRRARAPASEDPDAARIDPEAWRLLADGRLVRGDAVAAMAAGEDLAAIDRREGVTLLRLIATRLLDAHDAAAAEPIARRATELAGSDGTGWTLLSRAQEERGHLEDARLSIGRALAADPADPDALLAAGRLSLRRDDLPAARDWFQQLLRVAPDEQAAQLRVASSWLEAKRPLEALEVVEGAEGSEVLYLRGVALTRLGRTADAIHLLREGLARDPRDTVLLFALGEAYDRAGERPSALAQMKAVLEVNPDHAGAMNYLGYAYAEGDERLDEAEALLRRALRAEPDNAYYLDSFGWILYKRHDLHRAVEALERAAALAPELTILDHLGDAYRAARRPADAAGAYRRALQSQDPDEDEPGLSTVARRTLLQEKLDALGTHDERAARLRS